MPRSFLIPIPYQNEFSFVSAIGYSTDASASLHRFRFAAAVLSDPDYNKRRIN
jgi:hypothetical protein